MNSKRAGLLLLCLSLAPSLTITPAGAEPADQGRPAVAQTAVPADLDVIESAVAAGRLTQARIMLGRLDIRTASGPRFDLLLGHYYLARHEDVLARESFKRALSAQPNAAAATGAGIASLRLGELAEARKYLQAAVAADERDARAWGGLGLVGDATGDWKAAETAYSKALHISPDDPLILNNFGYSLMLQRRHAEALDLLGRAVKSATKEPAIRNNYRIALALSGDYAEAINQPDADFDLARQLNNAGYAAWLNRDIPAARALLARAIEAKPTHYGLAERNLAMVEQEASK